MLTQIIRVAKCNEHFVNSLIDVSDIDAKDRFGRTALHYAAVDLSSNESRIDLYAQLVDKGADVTARDAFGESPEQLKSAAKTYEESTESARRAINIQVHEFEQFKQSCFKDISSVREIYSFPQLWLEMPSHNN